MHSQNMKLCLSNEVWAHFMDKNYDKQETFSKHLIHTVPLMYPFITLLKNQVPETIK